MLNSAKLDKQRLNVYLAKYANVSRRQADQLIKAGCVQVNAKSGSLGQMVGSRDVVKLKGQEVKLQPEKYIYLAVNKPRGVICTTSGQNNNIIQLVNYPTRLFPIGRLDVATTGLIFLTNNGQVVNKILKAQNKVEKEYLATTITKISPEQLRRLGQSYVFDNRPTLPAKVKLIKPNQVSIIITEGLNHQIRRMIEAVGLQVQELQRIRIGQFKLADLKIKPGKFKSLPESEFNYKLGLK